jgi:predicted PurR-regulated permease PerM
MVVFTLAVLAVMVVVVLTVRVLLGVFAGILFAIALRALASFVAKHTRLPYAVVLTLLVLLLMGAAVTGVVLALPRLGDELENLRAVLPPAVHRLADSVGYGALLDRTKLHDLELDKFAAGALETVGTTFDALAGLVVCFFVAIYGAADPAAYERAACAVLPPRERPLAAAILRETGAELERWLLGRFVAMTFVGVTCAIAFVLLQVPLAIPLAFLAGILTFVEYIGAVASAVPAVLLAFSHGPITALWVALTFTGLHVIEGYVLTPLLARNMVRIPPALTLVSQALFGVLIGPLGLTFSTPLLVAAIAAGKEWRERRGQAGAAEQIYAARSLTRVISAGAPSRIGGPQ